MNRFSNFYSQTNRDRDEITSFDENNIFFSTFNALEYAFDKKFQWISQHELAQQISLCDDWHMFEREFLKLRIYWILIE